MQKDFRYDINGLRAIAVLAVVCFHFGISGFSGGFIGVDVFFVISGYLMTKILTSQLDAGGIETFHFYMNRLRRILPALLVTILATLIITAIFLLPQQFMAVGWEAIYSALFAINIDFAQSTGYFDPQASHSWFLHCWSLAVEMQFYLLVPIFLMIAKKLSPRHGVTYGLLLVIVGSLAFSWWETTTEPLSAFYMPFSRFWEFAVGGFVTRLSPSKRHHPWIAFVGVALVVAAAHFYNDKMAYPGVWPLLPVTGAAIILWAESGLVLLTNPAAQILGTTSYSIYLWHWPLLLAARYLGFADEVLGIVGLCVATFTVSIASYQWVETPFRQMGKGLRLVPALSSFGAIGIVSLIGYLIVNDQGAPWRIPSNILEITQKASYPNDWRARTCFLDADQGFEDFAPECLNPPGDGKPVIFLWGDSALANIYSGIARQPWAKQYRIEQSTASACPLPGLAPPITRPRCADIREKTLQFVLKRKPEIVVLSTAIETFGPATLEESRANAQTYGSKIRDLIVQLKSAGLKNVVVIGDFPAWDDPLPDVFYREIFRTGKIPETIRPPFFDNIRVWEQTMREIVEPAGAIYLSVIDALCDQKGCKLFVETEKGAILAQFDWFHFTKEGSDWVAANIIGPALTKLRTSGPKTSELNSAISNH